MPHDDFDPYRDTTTSEEEAERDEPFEDWPTRSLSDPIGEIQGYGRLARSVNDLPPGRKRTLGLLFVGILLAAILVPFAIGAIRQLGG